MGESALLQHQENVPILGIAGFIVAIAGAEFLWDLGRDYLIKDASNIDFAFDVTEDALVLQKDNPKIHWEKCCYIASARKFYSHLLSYGGFILHASTVVLDGKAYLFSADSGTGKSTHTALWCKHFGSNRAYILNDDKPIIRKVDGVYRAFGAPWCGSSCLGVNDNAPIQGIAFIERCEYDWIKPILPKDAFFKILQQSDPNVRRNAIDILLTLYNDFLCQVPIYQMGCTISDNAVLTSSKTMSVNVRDLACLSAV